MCDHNMGLGGVVLFFLDGSCGWQCVYALLAHYGMECDFLFFDVGFV